MQEARICAQRHRGQVCILHETTTEEVEVVALKKSLSREEPRNKWKMIPKRDERLFMFGEIQPEQFIEWNASRYRSV
jgi:hypothetical protein